MPAVAPIVTGVAGIYGASQQRGAAKDAARASQQATDAAIAEQRRQFDIMQANQQPWLDAGGWALGLQRDFLGGDYSAALNSPDYQAALQEGTKALDRGATAGGNLWGGGADADRIRLGQNLASQQIGNYWNRLAGLSNTGQATGAQLGAAGMGMANNIGGLLGNNAANRASSYQNAANANTGLGFGIAGAFNNWYQNRNPGVG